MKTNNKIAVATLLLCGGLLVGGFGSLNNETVYAAEGTSVFEVKSVSLRIPDATYGEGMRFTIVMDKDTYTTENVANLTTGLLVIPEYALGNEDLTVGLENAALTNVQNVAWSESADGTMMQIYLHLYGVPADQYTTDVCVRAYVDDGDDATTPIYTDVATSSVAKAADWLYDNDTTLDEDEKAALKATYLTYDVFFHNGEDVTESTGVYGEKIVEPTAPEKEGYAFGGWWNKNQTAEWDFASTTISGTETNLYAKWDIVTYTAKVVRADGSEETVAFTIENRAEKLAVIALTANDAQYTYSWESALPTELALNNSQVFTEMRVVNNYTVTFDTDGGSEIAAQPVPYGTDASALAQVTTTKTGYTFAGWTLVDGSEIPAGTKVTGNITVKAKWTPNTNTAYSVGIFLETNSGYSETATQTIAATGTTGATVTLDEGWMSENGLTVPDGYALDMEKSVFSGVVAADGSLVLKVYLKLAEYTVLFKDGNTVLAEKSLKKGAAISFDGIAPTKETAFIGWTEEVGSGVLVSSATVTGDMTFYAVYYNAEWLGFETQDSILAASVMNNRVSNMAIVSDNDASNGSALKFDVTNGGSWTTIAKVDLGKVSLTANTIITIRIKTGDIARTTIYLEGATSSVGGGTISGNGATVSDQYYDFVINGFTEESKHLMIAIGSTSNGLNGKSISIDSITIEEYVEKVYDYNFSSADDCDIEKVKNLNTQTIEIKADAGATDGYALYIKEVKSGSLQMAEIDLGTIELTANTVIRLRVKTNDIGRGCLYIGGSKNGKKGGYVSTLNSAAVADTYLNIEFTGFAAGTDNLIIYTDLTSHNNASGVEFYIDYIVVEEIAAKVYDYNFSSANDCDMEKVKNLNTQTIEIKADAGATDGYALYIKEVRSGSYQMAQIDLGTIELTANTVIRLRVKTNDIGRGCLYIGGTTNAKKGGTITALNGAAVAGEYVEIEFTGFTAGTDNLIIYTDLTSHNNTSGVEIYIDYISWN